MSKEIKIAVHNARFHADDVFGVATIVLYFQSKGYVGNDIKIDRTRDVEIIGKADYVLDVGGVYDESKNRFDHHQLGGAGKRENGIPYASFGLIWKKFGAELCGSEEVAEKLDVKIVQAIDAMDNGVDLYKRSHENVNPYLIQDVVFSFGSTWKESDRSTDDAFFRVVEIATEILEREIITAQDNYEGEKKFMEIYENAPDKRVVVMDKYYPYEESVTKLPEVLFVVRPNIQDDTWKVEATRDDIFSYKNRKDFPADWAGKRGEDLAKVSGVSDALFCHNGRFLVVAKTKEGAVKLANLAMEG